jgi:hypothetical protein
MIGTKYYRKSRKSPQTYVRVAVEPWTRADGGKTVYFVWRSLCRHCGQPFYVTTAAPQGPLAKSNVHCPPHQRAGPTHRGLARQAELTANG